MIGLGLGFALLEGRGAGAGFAGAGAGFGGFDDAILASIASFGCAGRFCAGMRGLDRTTIASDSAEGTALFGKNPGGVARRTQGGCGATGNACVFSAFRVHRALDAPCGTV